MIPTELSFEFAMRNNESAFRLSFIGVRKGFY